MTPKFRRKRILITPTVVLMLLFAGGRWWTDDIPPDAKIVDADYDDYHETFILELESPSFPLVSPDETPILDVVMHTGSREPTTGENHCVRVTL